MEEFKLHHEEEDAYKEKILSARDEVSIREKESSESEEFNIDDLDENEDFMNPKPKAEDKKADISKNGGFRDYSISKQQAQPDNSKMMFKTHDQSMYRAKAFVHAKTVTGKQKEGPHRGPVNHLGSSRKIGGDSKLEYGYNNILGDVMVLGMHIALRTPTKELELQGDATSIDCLGLSNLQTRNKIDEDLIEYEHIKDEYYFMEGDGSSSGSNLNSPIDTKGAAFFKINLSPELNGSDTKITPILDRRSRAETSNMEFLNSSMMMSTRTMGFGEVVRTINATHKDYTTEQHERQRRIHNSSNFVEILPKNLINRKISGFSPRNHKASLKNLKIGKILPNNVQTSKQSSKNSIISEPTYSQAPDTKASKGGFTEQAKNALYFSNFFNKFHNKDSSSSANDSPGSKPKKNTNTIESILSAEKTMYPSNQMNTSSSGKLSTSGQKNQGILNNLARLMLSVRPTDDTPKSDIHEFTQSLKLGSLDLDYLREDKNSLRFLKRPSVEIKTLENSNITDFHSGFDHETFTRKKKDKPEYLNILQSLHKNDNTHDESETDRSANTPINLDRTTILNKSLHHKANTKKPSMGASPKAVNSSMITRYTTQKCHSCKRKEYPLHSLDMVTEMSTISLMRCLTKIFHHLDMDPFVVNRNLIKSEDTLEFKNSSLSIEIKIIEFDDLRTIEVKSKAGNAPNSHLHLNNLLLHISRIFV